MRTKDLAKFILEREKVRVAKEAGKLAPWTKDKILSTYRFCNVHREDDKVTRWIGLHWREPYAREPDLWFLMVFARLFNLPSTLEWVGGDNVVNWRPAKVQRSLATRKDQGKTLFNGAYIVSTNGKAMGKLPYLFDYVLSPLWAARKTLRPREGDTLRKYHSKLMQYDGLGSFMAAQVVADLKYVQPLDKALDWCTWAASGPGSRRGLNRVFQYETTAPWNEATWYQHLMTLRTALLPLLENSMPPRTVALHGTSKQAVSVATSFELHAQDLQNCLCEFDKYERVRLGEGRPKQLYRS